MIKDINKHIRNPPQPPTPVLVSSKVGVCILTIVQIAIGAVYLKECPRQPYIPIYLIVAGSISMLLGIFCCLPCTQKSNKLSCICKFLNSMMCLFIFGWFLAGNVWIYSIYQPNYNNTTDIDSYCNKNLYLFAFWSTTLVYILLCLAFLFGFCFLFCICLCCQSLSSQVTQDDDV